MPGSASGAVGDSGRAAGDHAGRDRDEELVDEPGRDHHACQARPAFGDRHLPGEHADDLVEVDDATGAGPQLGHAIGRGSRVLGNHQRGASRFEQSGVTSRVWSIGDDVAQGAGGMFRFTRKRLSGS
jgi:hypothetical protein